MSPKIDQRLRDWAARIVPGMPVSLSFPVTPPTGNGIAICLCDLSGDPPPRGPKRPPLQILLRYLVTAWAEDVTQAHECIFRLMFSALENAEFDVEREAVPLALWQAHGIAPRPAFLLRVPLRQEQPEPETRMVTKPLVVSHSGMRIVEGTVVGPGDVPLMDALVEAPFFNLVTRTDSRGRFRFPALPAQQAAHALRVTVKGRELHVNTENSAAGETGGLLIRFHAEDRNLCPLT